MDENVLRELGTTFHDLMGVFVSMNLIVEEVQRREELPPNLKTLAEHAGVRMNELIPRLQSFYLRYR